MAICEVRDATHTAMQCCIARDSKSDRKRLLLALVMHDGIIDAALAVQLRYKSKSSSWPAHELSNPVTLKLHQRNLGTD